MSNESTLLICGGALLWLLLSGLGFWWVSRWQRRLKMIVNEQGSLGHVWLVAMGLSLAQRSALATLGRTGHVRYSHALARLVILGLVAREGRGQYALTVLGARVSNMLAHPTKHQDGVA